MVELEDIIPIVNTNNPTVLAELSASIDDEIEQRYSVSLLEKWLTYDQIAERLDYHVDESGMRVGKQPTPAAEPTPTQSPFQ